MCAGRGRRMPKYMHMRFVYMHADYTCILIHSYRAVYIIMPTRMEMERGKIALPWGGLRIHIRYKRKNAFSVVPKIVLPDPVLRCKICEFVSLRIGYGLLKNTRFENDEKYFSDFTVVHHNSKTRRVNILFIFKL